VRKPFSLEAFVAEVRSVLDGAGLTAADALPAG